MAFMLSRLASIPSEPVTEVLDRMKTDGVPLKSMITNPLDALQVMRWRA